MLLFSNKFDKLSFLFTNEKEKRINNNKELFLADDFKYEKLILVLFRIDLDISLNLINYY